MKTMTIIALLAALLPACAGAEDLGPSDDHAQLEAQAAAGNPGARQVLDGIEQFERLFPELLDTDLGHPADRDAALVDGLASLRGTGEAFGLACDPYWRIIRHGETGIYLKVGFDGWARVAPLQAGEGGREKFMLCLDTSQGSTHHVIWANAGGYLQVKAQQTYAVGLASTTNSPWAQWDEGMVGRWYFQKAWWSGYAQPTRNLGGLVFAHPAVDTLNGNALWDYLF